MNASDQAGSDKFPPLPGFGGEGGDEGESAAAQSRPNITPDLESAPNRSAVRPDVPPDYADSESGEAASKDSGSGGLPPLGRFGDPSPVSGDAADDGLRGALPPIVDEEPAASDPSSPMATTQKSSNDPFIGKTFAGYTIVEGIGQGGMGMVYKGKQASLDRDVAIKMLNKALIDNDEFIRRFEREAKSMANVHHPNIVSVIDFGVQDGIYFMVAEYVEGTNLSKMIRQQLMVPATDLVPILVQCLNGLDYVAKQNVVHRDIKPDNILIDKDGVAKIADFGLAKDFSKEETDLTAAGSAMGTPSYMSPEQCMGRPLDVRSDIYSFGVTAYYALTGEKPFTGQSSFEIMTKQREHVPPAPHQINPQVPKELADVIMQMLEKDPSKRYENAEICRDAWLGVGQELGIMGPVTRSGEYFFHDHAHDSGPQVPTGMMSADGPGLGVSYPGAEEAPVVPDMQLSGANELPPEAPSLPSSPPAPVGLEDRHAAPASSAEHDSVQSDSEILPKSRLGKAKEGTSRDRRQSTRLTNREPVTLQQADALVKQGKFRKAAEAYAKLAEQETDRKQRSILRTKERDARSKASEQGSVVDNRIRQLVDQGHYKNALKMLEEARASSASSVVDKRFSNEILKLRTLLQQRRRRVRLITLLIILAVVGGGGWFFREQIGDFLRGLVVQERGKPEPGTGQPVPAPESGPAPRPESDE